MVDAAPSFAGVAEFRMKEFRHQREFDDYLKESEALRSYRWLYEQSLASPKANVVLDGTCGLCLCPARFTAPTRGGEMIAAGRVPHWREGLACDCERRLINRERALLHFLLATEALHPAMQVLGLGELGGVAGVLRDWVTNPILRNGALDSCLARLTQFGAAQGKGFHLAVSVEQLEARSATLASLTALAGLLVGGGRLVFTAPFNANAATGASDGAGPIDWSILGRLTEAGFLDAKACLFWSEELGYLDTMNFAFSASR